MIPFSILSGQLHMATGGEKEFSVLELGPDYFTTRFSKEFSEGIEKADGITLHFYHFSKNEYFEIGITDYTVTKEPGDEFFDCFKVLVNDKAFREESVRLSKEYLTYIDNRLSLNDDELSSEYTDYPVGEDENFYKDYEECFKGFIEKTAKNGGFKELPAKLYFELSEEKELKRLLETGPKQYRSRYWKELCKLNPAFSQIEAKGFVIGNSYCINLLPDYKLIKAVTEECEKNEKEVYITIAPVPECLWESTADTITHIIENINWIEGFIVNDMGLFMYVKEKYPSLRVIKGVLLNKAYRDARSKYLSISNELMYADGFLYGPLYQTNTATFCTLHALVHKGDRSKLERITACEQACLTNKIMYPRHMDAIGMYNSIFGFSPDFLTTEEFFHDFCEGGFEGLVINL